MSGSNFEGDGIMRKTMTNLVNVPISKTAHDNAEVNAPWDDLDACWTVLDVQAGEYVYACEDADGLDWDAVLAACGMADWGEGALATVSYLEGGIESHATFQADGEGGWAEISEY